MRPIPSQERPDLAAAAALGAAVSAAYLAFPSRQFVIEGLARAMHIDLWRWKGIFPGCYIAYGALSAAFHALSVLAGHAGSALYSLQRLDALLGSAGVLAFFLALRELEVRRGSALAWAAVLAFSFCHWQWCAEAEVYALCALALELNLLAMALFARGRLSERAAGAALGAAVLSHLVNGALAAPWLWLVLRRRGGARARPVLAFAASATSVVAGAYALALALAVRPASFMEAWQWLLCSAGAPGGSVGWHGRLGLAGLSQWAATTARLFFSAEPAFSNPPPWPAAHGALLAAKCLLALSAAAAVPGLSRLRGARRAVAWACGAWVLAYACVFTSWEPATLRYRIGDLAPLCALFALGLPDGLASAFGAVLAGLLGLGNLGAEIFPASRASNNPLLARMEFIREHTEDAAWIATPGGTEALYLPYFAQRRPIALGFHGGDQEGAAAWIGRIRAGGGPVYATGETLSDPEWGRLLSRFKPKESARSERGFVLFRLGR